jgi:hypothetical protein
MSRVLGCRHTRYALEALIDKFAGGEGEEGFHKGLSHPAKEVFWALSTQLPAIAALLVLADKGMEELKEGGMPFNNRLFILMEIVALLTTQADNAAAYVFGEGAATSLLESEFGEEVYNENPGLVQAQADAMLEDAVVNGGVDQIANGANFAQRVHKAREDEFGNVVVEVRPLKLAESYKNGYAIPVGQVAVIDGFTKILRNISAETREKARCTSVENTEHSAGAGLGQDRYGRRQLFRRIGNTARYVTETTMKI